MAVTKQQRITKDTVNRIDDALFNLIGLMGELAADLTPLKDSDFKSEYEHISSLQIELVKAVRSVQ